MSHEAELSQVLLETGSPSFVQLLRELVACACASSAATGPTGPPGPPPDVIFTGQGLGNFSSANRVRSADGGIIDFTRGKTLWLILQAGSFPASLAGTIVGSYDTTGDRGWSLEVFPDRTLHFLSDNVEGDTTIELKGVLTLCFVWSLADSHMRCAVNGYWIDCGVMPAPTPPGGTWQSVIGTALGIPGRENFGGRVLAIDLWDFEATQNQAQSYTFTQGNRYSLRSEITSVAAFDFNAPRDFNPAGFSTLGTSPVTFVVTGSPALGNLAEKRIVTEDADYFDGKFSEFHVDGGYAYTVRNPYIRLPLTIDADTVAAEAFATDTWFQQFEALGCYISGSYHSSESLNINTQFPIVTPHPSIPVFSLGPGAGKSVDLWEGSGDSNDFGFQPYFRFGSFIQAVRVPTLAFDGVTVTSGGLRTPPPPPAHRLVIVSDFTFDWLLPGTGTDVPANKSAVALLRQAYPHPVSGVTHHGWASLGMASFATSDTRVALLEELDGTSTNTVWFLLGNVDWRGPLNTGECSVADFQAYYQAVVDAVCAAKPGVHLYLMSPIQEVSPPALDENTPNGFGNTLPQYRAAIAAVAAGVYPGCTVTYVNGAAGAVIGMGNMDASGIYPNQAGLAELASFVGTTLSGAGLLALQDTYVERSASHCSSRRRRLPGAHLSRKASSRLRL